jgi:cupin fold WbuC family metalloprotein
MLAESEAIFIESGTIDALIARARAAPRRRVNLNLHATPADPIQRFLNAGDPESYIRPHRHAAARWELFCALRGGIDAILFAADGTIARRCALAAGAAAVIEIPGATWHSFVFTAPGSVALEVKPGPYVAALDKEFAPWAPAEEDPASTAWVRWIARAAAGARWRGV